MLLGAHGGEDFVAEVGEGAEGLEGGAAVLDDGWWGVGGGGDSVEGGRSGWGWFGAGGGVELER